MKASSYSKGELARSLRGTEIRRDVNLRCHKQLSKFSDLADVETLGSEKPNKSIHSFMRNRLAEQKSTSVCVAGFKNAYL
jgi:hypothetical protein